MESLQEISTTSSVKMYRVKTARTVEDLLKELHLETKFFIILVDGRKVSLNDTIKEGSEITILPKIAGGY